MLNTSNIHPQNSSNLVVHVGVFIFREEGNYIAYSPSLDTSGYGLTKEEAMESFELTLEEFLRYSLTQETLEGELKRLGWTVSGRKQKRKYSEPKLIDLLKQDYLASIFDDKEFAKTNRTVNLPIPA